MRFFVNSALKTQRNIVNTPTDCFFGDFAHWVNSGWKSN